MHTCGTKPPSGWQGYIASRKEPDPQFIYFITADDKEGDSYYYFIECSEGAMESLQQSKMSVFSIISPDYTIHRSGEGKVPTEQDLAYMQVHHNFSMPSRER